MIDDIQPYDPELERGYFESDVRDLLSCFKQVDGVYYVRCADNRWRPVDRYTAYRITELEWTKRLSFWRKHGRVGKAPESPNFSEVNNETWLDRIRIMLGKVMS